MAIKLSPHAQFRAPEENKALASGFINVPGSKSRRMYNPSTGEEISVRQYQRLQKGQDAVNIQRLAPAQIDAYNALKAQSREATRLQRFYKAVEAGNSGESLQASL